MAANPLPDEFEEVHPATAALARLESRGAVVTNGYRTGEDVQRLKRRGYTPADDGAHNYGDGVDLTPGGELKSLGQLRIEALRAFGRGAKVEIHNGSHVHVAVPNWHDAPDTTRADPMDEFEEVAPAVAARVKAQLRVTDQPKAVGHAGAELAATGEAHDGDTIRLTDGRNGRLLGYDAFELGQSGRRPDGSLVPLGDMSREFMGENVSDATPVHPTGATTYGRPVITLGEIMHDPALGALRRGLGIAEPDYLKGSPQFGPYMEAERLARFTRQGGHATNAETPSQFRHKNGPWKGVEPGAYGKDAEAIFWDEPMPFQGLRPEIAKGYQAIAGNPDSTAKDLLDYAAENGFVIDPDDAEKFVKKRKAAGGKFDPTVRYSEPPKPLTNVGDDAAGSALRGFADPINVLDEFGAVADTVIPGVPDFDGPRENIWNSGDRFGDIYGRNVDINRSILGYDEEFHPVARIGGQLASGLVAPTFAVEGAAARATARALEQGFSRFAAEEIGKQVLRRRLAALGGGEGALGGLGAGEGDLLERTPNALAGTAAGAAGGLFIGEAVGALSPVARRVIAKLRRGEPVPEEVVQDVAAEIAPMLNDRAQNAGPTPAARGQRQGGVVDLDGEPGERFAAMDMEDQGPELVGPVVRDRDYLDLGPAAREGSPVNDPALGRTPRMGEQPTAEEVADAARGVVPEDVTPLPANRVETIEEAARANPGRFEDLEPPNELEELRVRRLASQNDLYKKIHMRGPFDMTKTLRRAGGVKDEGGELSHLGIDGKPRRLPFGGNEQFLGKLIDNDRGMSLDEAGEMLWEQGYFKERPTVAEVIDALHDEHLGNSHYLPEDLPEIAAFQKAQAERYGIEHAKTEGRPLTEERGVPATMEDLRANQPPVTAYEDLGTLGGKVANVDLSRIETREDVGRLLRTTEHKLGGFDAARRGAITHAETEALASELNMTADDLLRRRKGQALNAEQALQARRILAKSGEEVVALAGKARNGSDEQLMAFQRAVIRHAAIQEQVTGATAEAGRALNQFRIVAKSSAHRERIIKAAIQNMGGRDSLEDMAGLILEAQRDPAALNRFVVDAVKPTWKDKLVELWYNSLLSGPSTHAVNILSNTLTMVGQLPEHAAAAAIGSGRAAVSKLRGRGLTDRVLFSEVGARTVGLLQGAQEGTRAFKHTLLTGDVPDIISKVESTRHEAIGGVAGKVIRTPTRLLSAEDEFFKASARRMEIAGLAVRKARTERLKGEKLRARIADLTRNPTDEMVESAMDYARYVTFQRPLGPSMQKVMGIVQDHPWLKLFVPFIRTPTNIFKYAIERSPAGFMLKEVRRDMMAGGSKRDLAVAKMGLGTGLGLMVAQWAAQGTITGGGPADESQRRAMLAEGWQPYSIKIGGKYYSYKRLDPLATTIGVAADLVELGKAGSDGEKSKATAVLIGSIMQNLENKTWLSGISDVLGVIEDPERNSQHFLERLAGSIAVPALVAQSARALDPVQRETSSESVAAGIVDAIKARVPGLSQQLKPRRDMFGEEVRNEGGLGPDLASPIWTSTAKDDPAAREVRDSAAVIGPVSRNVGGGKLSDKMFDQYQSIAGQLTRQYILEERGSADWKKLAPADRKKAIEDARDDARKDARAAVLEMQ